ncbi:MAG: CDP-diacylglycerol--glycerol-3-phosphate 3-phosphatidyltransferase [Clostridia bacterium]|nr:CDP-diacylglycerol--glycerol-3-phosphate 3-phosphatidyltransferase [Clostridia bacterium]
MNKNSNWNIPNILTVIRVILVPFFMLTVLLPGESNTWRIIAALMFALISFTDMLDGKIARKYNLVTDFGKFLDPLADKFLVLGALLALLKKYSAELGDLLVWVTLAVILRELAVTSLRLVAVNKSGTVIAASIWGKIKTVSQMVSVCFVLLEPVIVTPYLHTPAYLFSVITLVIMLIATIFSGIDYFVKFFKA